MSKKFKSIEDLSQAGLTTASALERVAKSGTSVDGSADRGIHAARVVTAKNRSIASTKGSGKAKILTGSEGRLSKDRGIHAARLG